MLSLKDRSGLLKMLGEIFRDLSSGSPVVYHREYAMLKSRMDSIESLNPWFTSSSVNYSLMVWGQTLTPGNIDKWLTGYDLPANGRESREVTVIMAGNIPLVGFHDFLSVVISGQKFIGKMSSKDNILFPLIVDWVYHYNEDWKDYIDLVTEISTPPAILIATGSNNTSRLMRDKYKDIPSLIRHNRNSLAVLTGNESSTELANLASDILLYYGLGCRNVSLVIIPEGMDMIPLVREIRNFNISLPLPYLNNLKYQKAKAALSKSRYLDAEKILFVFNHGLYSPLGVVNLWEYQSPEEVNSFIKVNSGNIQCIAGDGSIKDNMVPFGKTQMPGLDEYADGIDTVNFLLSN